MPATTPSPQMRPVTLDTLRRRAAWEGMRQRFAADGLQAPTSDQLLADLVDPFRAHRRRHPLMALAWDLGVTSG